MTFSKFLLSVATLLVAALLGTVLVGMTEEQMPASPEAIEYFDIKLVADPATGIKPSPTFSLEVGETKTVYYSITNNFVNFTQVGYEEGSGSVKDKINMQDFASNGSANPRYCTPFPHFYLNAGDSCILGFVVTALGATTEKQLRPKICAYDTKCNNYSIPITNEDILKVTVEEAPPPPPEAIFSFTPNVSSVSVVEKNTATINYKIENVSNVNLSEIYVKDTFPSEIASGVPVFNLPGTTCSSEPFSLAAGDSCVLTFEITGLKASAAAYIFAPEICDKASEVYCAKPEDSSAVQVTVLSPTPPSLQWVSKGVVNNTVVKSLLNIDSEIYAGVFSTGVYQLNNMGQWIQLGGSLPGCSCNVYSLTNDGTDIYAGTSNGVYQFKNGSWQRLDNNKTSLVNAVLYADGELYAAFYEAVYRLNVDASVFEIVGSSPVVNVRTLYYGDGQLYAGGPSGAYRLTAGGDWQAVGSYPGVIDSFLIFDGELYAGGICTGVNRFDSANNKWEKVGGPFSGNNCVSSLAEANGALYAATAQNLPNEVYRLSTDGNNWEIAAEGLPENPDVRTMLNVSGVLYAGTISGKIWALQ